MKRISKNIIKRIMTFVLTVSMVLGLVPIDGLMKVAYASETTYSITIADGIINGTVTADKTTAVKGETVTLTISPDNLYELYDLSVKCGENAVPFYWATTSFVMPDGDVTVNVSFKKKTTYTTFFKYSGKTFSKTTPNGESSTFELKDVLDALLGTTTDEINNVDVNGSCISASQQNSKWMLTTYYGGDSFESTAVLKVTVGGSEYSIDISASQDSIPVIIQGSVRFDANGGSGTMDTMSGRTDKFFVLPECSFTPPDGMEFDNWKIGSDYYQAGTIYRWKESVIAYAQWKDIAGVHRTDVNNPEPSKGSLVVFPTKALQNTNIVLTPQPANGYAVDSISYSYEGSDTLQPTANQDGTYSFSMPDKDVTVTITFKEDTAVSIPYLDANGNNANCTSNTYVSESDTTWNTGWYVVNRTLTINNRIVVDGNVNLILADGATLNAQSGITVYGNNSLNIFAQSTGENKGKLCADATQKPNYAAIGGANSEETMNCGSVNIYGGYIEAHGGQNSAGIGGGDVSAYKGGSGGTITINAGTIKSYGGNWYGAGIGGGRHGNGGVIRINGGYVETYGNYGAAGIGGGLDGESGIITITGGTVLAKGSICEGYKPEWGAGIGSGRDAETNKIEITGGNVTAYGASDSAAIGSGRNKKCNEIIISGGVINAIAYSTKDVGIGSSRSSTSTGTISLSWTSVSSDEIYSSSYKGTVTLKKAFVDKSDSTVTFASSVISDNSTIDGKTIVPYDPSTHYHRFTYAESEDGTTITATCANLDGNCPLPNKQVALRINAPASLTYDGEAKTATITGDTSVLGTPSIAYKQDTVALVAAPVNAGTYTASITLEDATASVSYTIEPKPVTITGLSAENKEYDGTTAATITGTGTIEGKVGSDDVSVDTSDGTATFDSADVGTDRTVTFSGYALSGESAGNYTLSSQPANVTANITARAITVTANDQSVEPGGSIATGTDQVSVTGEFANEQVFHSVNLALAEGKNTDAVGEYEGAIVPSGAVINSASDKNVTANYAITYVNGKLTVTKIKAKVTTAPEPIEGLVYNGQEQTLVTGGVADTAMEYALGENADTAPTTGYGDTVPNGKEAKDSYYVWYRAKADDKHDASDPAVVIASIGKATINSVAVSIDAPTANEDLDTAATTDTTGVTLNNSGAITWNPAAPQDGKAEYAKAYTAAVTATSADNYTFADIVTATVNGQSATTAKNDDGTLTISYTFDKTTLNPVTITAADKDVTYSADGIAIPVEGMFAIPEGAGAATYAVENGTGEGTYDAQTGKLTVTKCGIFTIKVSTAESDTHAAGAETTATLTVNKANNPAIIAATVSVMKSGSSAELVNNVDLAGNVTLNGATGAVNYSISGDANGCTLSDSVLTAGSNTGTVTVNVSIEADDNYNPLAATPITVTITNKQTQTIAAENMTVTYGDTGKSVSAMTDGDGTLSYAVKSGDAVTVDASSGALTIVKAGTATVTVTASGTATYEQATRDVTVTVNKAAVTVTANAQSKTFGDTDPELTYTAEGLIGRDKLTGALAREDGQDVGEYGITAGTLTAGNNYDIDFTGSKLTINPKDIADAVISFEADAIVYTGDVIEPKITEVKLGDTVLTGDDYEIDADSDASGTNYGTYTLKINGKGNYTGTAEKVWKITKPIPTVDTLPNASAIRVGSELSTSKLTGGRMVYNETEVPGTFAWAEGTIKPEISDSNTTEYEVIFTPDDLENFEPATFNMTVTVRKKSSGGGSSSGGSSGGSSSSGGGTTYVVSTPKSTDGTIKASTYNATKGTKVTITVTPEEGYEVDTITVTDKDGNAVEVTKNEDGTFSYVQPASKVTVDATYKKEGTSSATPAPTTEPQATVKPSDGNSDKWWFKDVPETTWYYNPIKEAFDNSRMSGMSDDYFEPETDITRGMFAYAIYRREGLPETNAQNKFEDVMSATYYEKAIAWATENGIVAGYDDTNYGPDDHITREQMAAILYRYAQFKEYDVSKGEETNILDFTDAPDISEYAVPAIQWAVSDSVITGFEDGTMRPKSNANRAQMAVILNKIADLF